MQYRAAVNPPIEPPHEIDRREQRMKGAECSERPHQRDTRGVQALAAALEDRVDAGPTERARHQPIGNLVDENAINTCGWQDRIRAGSPAQLIGRRRIPPASRRQHRIPGHPHPLLSLAPAQRIEHVVPGAEIGLAALRQDDRSRRVAQLHRSPPARRIRRSPTWLTRLVRPSSARLAPSALTEIGQGLPRLPRRDPARIARRLFVRLRRRFPTRFDSGLLAR